jgi:hypothetical protein
VTAKPIAVKRYVVKLSDEERGRLNTLIHAGKHPARLLTKARRNMSMTLIQPGSEFKLC